MLAALLSTMIVQVPASATASPTAGAAQLSEGQQALANALESGKQVELPSQQSERTTVLANPDGFTFTLQESSVPVRVSRPGGGWRPPDATLEKRTDGSIGPKAAAPQIAFSGGRENEPLARIADGGNAVELTWLDKLPAPTLDGATATYADVLPDVDLKVTATAESFQHVLVVKTPEAAANEELKKLTFGLKTTGVDVQKGPAGNLAAIDADGQTVFRSPPAQMWNSAGKNLPAPPAVVTKRAAPDETAPSGLVEATTSGSGLEPGQGDVVAKMAVQISKDTLSITPDETLLAEKDESAFPLFIDPAWTWGASERTLLRSDGYESYAWGNGKDDMGQGAGKCGTWAGYYCGPGYVQRLYFEFSPASLKGKHILDATFRVTEPWAFQCEPRWVDLVRTKQNISSSTTWATRPQGGWDTMGDRHVSAGRGDLCAPGLPDAAIEFNDNPAETNENLTPTVRDFAAGKFARLTLMIKANDETDTAAWKRFRNDAVLEVKYVGLPALPTDVGLVTGSGLVCSTNSAAPTVVSDPTPLVTGRPKTASGGSAEANLRIRWRTDKWNGTAWATAHTDLDGPTTGYAANLAKQSRSLPALQEGVQYRLKALTMSYYEGGSNRLNTGYTTPCYFKVDPTAPKAPKIALGSPYTECLPNDCAAKGAPGQRATFAFAPASGDAGVVSYEYALSGMTGVSTATGSTANVQLTPERAGTYTLRARAKDTVGRYGAWNAVDFLVAAGAGPVARYHFDEASGVALDTASPGGADNATLGGGAVRDDRGRRGLISHDAQGEELPVSAEDKGLSLNGTSAYAQTEKPVVETRSAFTLSAWVRMDKNDAFGTVLAQRDQGGLPFFFVYSPTLKTWYFGIRRSDGTGAWGKAAIYPAETGVWTHLAGTYDPAKKELHFYVDGRLQGGPVTVDGSWQSTEPLQIGRAQTGPNSYVQHFPGSIDEVALWQRVLTAQEIADEAKLLTSAGFAAAELVADWAPERGSGTTVADTTSGYGRNLTLTGGALLDGDAIVLDGVDDAATTPGPLVYDHAAFTVSTLVQLNGAHLLAKNTGYIGQVLGQRTADGSAWGFWFELTGKRTELTEEGEEVTVPEGVWHFGRLEADGKFSSVVSEQVAALDSPVRLTGVYNSLDGTISLYLGHTQNGEAQEFTIALGAGDFAIGKGFTGGAWKHYLPARIGDVRLWAGAMASSEQIDYRVGD
ncbi:LamG-like jellyroll fold domain-containing protein [Streptomyces microflavus]|uniref:LamG-like jellyroll fold domain-containing protein n=2 Tax=Streptomyces microflavus TaxID=1919 RepID=UPI0036974604